MHAAKRQKLDEAVLSIQQNQQKSIQTVSEGEQPTYFSDLLNDHCVLEILAYLDLKNLCSMGQTCRRLYRLAKYHFGLQYPKEAKQVEQFEKRERNWLTSIDLNCFADYKTMIFDKNSMCPTLITNFVNVQMNKPTESRIKGAIFAGFSDNRYLTNCKLLHAVLHDVQVVSFVNMRANGLYDSILQYCPSMQKLIIRGEFCVNCNGWLSQKYPKLVQLSLHTNNDIEWKDVQQLIQQNPNINVSLLSQNTDNINRFIDNGVTINELHIQVKYNFDYYMHYLKAICSKSISIRLHLVFADNVRRNLSRHIQHLVVLKNNIDGLYFKQIELDKETVNGIMKIDRLNILQIPIKYHTQALAHLPNLKEVYIFPYMIRNGAPETTQYLELLYKLAGQCKSLQKLVYRYPTKNYHDIQLSILDSVNYLRMALNGAERLKLCCNTSASHQMSFDTIDALDIRLVELRPLVTFK